MEHDDEIKSSGIPTVDLEDFDIPEEEDRTIEDRSGGSLKFGFLGAGQCGSRIADTFHSLGYTKNIVLNTTNQDMKGISVPDRIIMTREGLSGGAGKDMALARELAEDHREEVYNMMMNIFGPLDHIFVCAGLGGGSGGGSILPLIETAKRYMNFLDIPNQQKSVGAIVTLPSHGEAQSPTVAKNALEVGRKLSAMADSGEISPLIIVDNDKIKRMYKKLTMANFYPTVNRSIAQLLHIFNVISTESSEFTTFDAKDFRTTVENGGHMIMGVTVVKASELEDQTSVADALRKNLDKTLLASGFDLTSAKVVAMVCVGGYSEFNDVPGLNQTIENGFDTMANLTGNAIVHRGVYADDRNGALRVYTLLAGLKAPKNRYNKLNAS